MSRQISSWMLPLASPKPWLLFRSLGKKTAHRAFFKVFFDVVMPLQKQPVNFLSVGLKRVDLITFAALKYGCCMPLCRCFSMIISSKRSVHSPLKVRRGSGKFKMLAVSGFLVRSRQLRCEKVVTVKIARAEVSESWFISRDLVIWHEVFKAPKDWLTKHEAGKKAS